MAIEKAGSTNSAKVRDAMLGAEFKGTMMGDLKFDDKGNCILPSLALQWWDGEENARLSASEERMEAEAHASGIAGSSGGILPGHPAGCPGSRSRRFTPSPFWAAARYGPNL